MNKETLKGHWNELKGKIKQQWGKLTDNDISQINGNIEELKGKLQKTYGYQKDEAEKQINSFLDKSHHKETEK